jgi:cytochrome b561
MLKNTTSTFGAVIGTLVLLQVYFIYWREWVLPPKSPISHFYLSGLHEPVGMLILPLATLWIVWRLATVRPGFPNSMPAWEILAAKIAHFLLYTAIIVMPISGLIMAVAAGYPPNFFGLFEVPSFIEKSREISGFFSNVHTIAAYITISVVVLHILAALKHHFMDRDDILKRMLP